ncbi:hypothetical protein BC830DRAFT_1114243 [Chytriomyces sp. MP71]|nr:hypothetical protein BC830DRAFT_1114243 [Chytriomyces sp. MP71]
MIATAAGHHPEELPCCAEAVSSGAWTSVSLLLRKLPAEPHLPSTASVRLDVTPSYNKDIGIVAAYTGLDGTATASCIRAAGATPTAEAWQCPVSELSPSLQFIFHLSRDNAYRPLSVFVFGMECTVMPFCSFNGSDPGRGHEKQLKLQRRQANVSSSIPAPSPHPSINLTNGVNAANLPPSENSPLNANPPASPADGSAAAVTDLPMRAQESIPPPAGIFVAPSALPSAQAAQENTTVYTGADTPFGAKADHAPSPAPNAGTLATMQQEAGMGVHWSVGAMVGCAVGVAVALLALVFLALLWRKRARAAKKEEGVDGTKKVKDVDLEEGAGDEAEFLTATGAGVEDVLATADAIGAAEEMRKSRRKRKHRKGRKDPDAPLEHPKMRQAAAAVAMMVSNNVTVVEVERLKSRKHAGGKEDAAADKGKSQVQDEEFPSLKQPLMDSTSTDIELERSYNGESVHVDMKQMQSRRRDDHNTSSDDDRSYVSRELNRKTRKTPSCDNDISPGKLQLEFGVDDNWDKEAPWKSAMRRAWEHDNAPRAKNQPRRAAMSDAEDDYKRAQRLRESPWSSDEDDDDIDIRSNPRALKSHQDKIRGLLEWSDKRMRREWTNGRDSVDALNLETSQFESDKKWEQILASRMPSRGLLRTRTETSLHPRVDAKREIAIQTEETDSDMEFDSYRHQKYSRKRDDIKHAKPDGFEDSRRRERVSSKKHTATGTDATMATQPKRKAAHKPLLDFSNSRTDPSDGATAFVLTDTTTLEVPSPPHQHKTLLDRIASHIPVAIVETVIPAEAPVTTVAQLDLAQRFSATEPASQTIVQLDLDRRVAGVGPIPPAEGPIVAAPYQAKPGPKATKGPIRESIVATPEVLGIPRYIPPAAKGKVSRKASDASKSSSARTVPQTSNEAILFAIKKMQKRKEEEAGLLERGGSGSEEGERRKESSRRRNFVR